MVPSRLIGPFVTTPPTAPSVRRFSGRAVVPGLDDLRTTEMFDARPALNTREEIVTSNNSSLQFLRMARMALMPDAPGYNPIAISLPKMRRPSSMSIAGRRQLQRLPENTPLE